LCQGNLQHARLLLLPGLHPINRLHLCLGVMAYPAAPLWMLMLVISTIEGIRESAAPHTYFPPGPALYPSGKTPCNSRAGLHPVWPFPHPGAGVFPHCETASRAPEYGEKGETMKTCKYSMTRLMRVVKIGVALGTAIIGASALQGQDSPSAPAPVPGSIAEISHRAKEFLQDAAQANQTEMAMADVAEGRSQNSAVKELAQMMRSDHQQNYAQLQVIAQNHLIALDSSLNMMNQHAVNHLRKVSDADFDKDYTKAMLKDHVKCITRFDKAIAEIEEPYVREYAQSTLPALRKHLRHTEDAARSVGVDETTISSILKGLPSDEAQRSVTFNQN
jgi:putative membrane protein